MILGMQIFNISFTFLLVFFLFTLLKDAVSLVLKDEGFTLPFPQAKTAICIEKTLNNSDYSSVET